MNAAMNIGAISRFLGELMETIQAGPDPEAHDRLFEGIDPHLLISRWESAARSDLKVLLNETTLAVTEIYLTENILPEMPGEPADDILFELSFLQFLLEEGKFDKAAMFYQEHCRFLLCALCEQVKSAGISEWYCRWAASVLERIPRLDEQISSLAKRPGRNMGNADAKDPSHLAKGSVPVFFRTVSREQREEYGKERLVLTYGQGNCGGRCSVGVRVRGGCILGVQDHVLGPVTDKRSGEERRTAHLCMRGRAYPATFLRADRIRHPLLRTGKRGEGKFRRITWAQALELLLKQTDNIKAKYGPGSRYVNYAYGITGMLNAAALMKHYLSLDGGFLDYYLSYSSAQVRTAIRYTFGTQIVNPPAYSLRSSRLLILWGFNPVVTMNEPGLTAMLKFHKKKGTPVIVIDPIYTETAAAFATEWICIRPGTDSALADAMAWVLYTNQLQDQAFMDRCCVGFDRDHMPDGFQDSENYHDYIFGVYDGIPKTPAWAETITGVNQETIRRIALLYGSTKPAALLPGWGPQRHFNGEHTVRSQILLQCMTGNIGIEGGSAGCQGSSRQHAKPSIPLVKNPYHAAIPCFLWTDAVDHGHLMTAQKDRVTGREALNADIRQIFNLAGNALINQHSDIRKTADLLSNESKCEFIVAEDLFFTPSVLYADLVLPGVSMFERDNMGVPWGDGQYLLYGNAALPPLFECRGTFEWIREMAKVKGYHDFALGAANERELLEKVYDNLRDKEPELPDFSIFKTEGGYIYRESLEEIAFLREAADPVSCPFPTETGKIEIFSPALARLSNPAQIPAIPRYVPEPEGAQSPLRAAYPLQLLSPHSKRRTHSVHDNNVLLERAEPQQVWISTEDARVRDIHSGDLVEIKNLRGRVRVRVKVTDRLMPGTAALPEGAWVTWDEKGIDIRGSANVLTGQEPSPLAKANPQDTCLVEITKA